MKILDVENILQSFENCVLSISVKIYHIIFQHLDQS